MGKIIKIDQKSRKYRGQNIKNSKCQKCLKLTEKQGNTGNKLFFPQNVKIPEIRKFTTNWHPCTIVHGPEHLRLGHGHAVHSLELHNFMGPCYLGWELVSIVLAAVHGPSAPHARIHPDRSHNVCPSGEWLVHYMTTEIF